ncbi:MAG: toll/interleukin-1 receptor domain-containing protein [Paracoccaceae bacterium]|nr:toll/interleukin-1 receptor domain-containing protein [Paracoccaceae bacterium]
MTSKIDVFISYKREERALSERVKRALIDAGYTAVTDLNIGKNDEFGDAIDTMIRTASLTLVLWTREAAGSDWVRKEARLARDLQKAGKGNHYLGVMVEDVDLDLPPDLRGLQMVDIHGGGLDDDGLAQVLDDVREILGAEARQTAQTAEADNAALTEEWQLYILARSINVAAAYERYLRKYPQGEFAQDAILQLQKLRPLASFRRGVGSFLAKLMDAPSAKTDLNQQIQDSTSNKKVDAKSNRKSNSKKISIASKVTQDREILKIREIDGLLTHQETSIEIDPQYLKFAQLALENLKLDENTYGLLREVSFCLELSIYNASDETFLLESLQLLREQILHQGNVDQELRPDKNPTIRISLNYISKSLQCLADRSTQDVGNQTGEKEYGEIIIQNEETFTAVLNASEELEVVSDDALKREIQTLREISRNSQSPLSARALAAGRITALIANAWIIATVSRVSQTAERIDNITEKSARIIKNTTIIVGGSSAAVATVAYLSKAENLKKALSLLENLLR